jgi:hypothetical protein
MNPYRAMRIVAIVANVGVLLIRIPSMIAIEEQARTNHGMDMAVAFIAGICLYLAFNIPAITALVALGWAESWTRTEHSVAGTAPTKGETD